MIVRKQLCANETQLVDHESLGLKPRAPSKSVNIRVFTSIGSTVSNRAKIHFERRLMNNTNELNFQEL